MEDTVFTRNLVGEKKKTRKEAVQHRGRYIFFLVSMLHVQKMGNQLLHLILMKKRRDKDILNCR